MYFLSQIKFQFITSVQSFFEGPAVGPDPRDIVEQNNSNLEDLSPEEKQRAIELQQIQVEISAVINAKEITEEYLKILEQGFARVLDDIQDLTEEDLNDSNSDYAALVNRISLLHEHMRDLTQEELKLRLLEIQGQTTSALNDLMEEVILADIEITSEGRADLFTEASDSLSDMIDSIEGLSSGQQEYLKHIIEIAGGLENISANDMYLMKSVGIDLASLFLVNSEGRARKDTMEEGDIFLVNFGGNYSVDRAIGAGDILNISQVYKVQINGVEGIRAHSPRPGYYTPDGRYLAIHDGYRIEVIEKKEFSEDENSEDFENSTLSRIEDFRREQVDTWMYENIFHSDQKQMEVPFVMDVDRVIIANYIEESLSESLLFDAETGIISVKPPYSSFETALEKHFGALGGDFEPRPGESLARDPAFLGKLNRICDRLGVNPSHMLIVMRAESGIDPRAVNSNGGATGLIQFMPTTAKGLGTTTYALLGMSGLQQLDYVEKYFAGYAGKLNSVEDLYKVTFFPVAVGQPLSWVFRSRRLSAQTVAQANQAIARYSTRADGTIDGHAFRRYVNAHIANA